MEVSNYYNICTHFKHVFLKITRAIPNRFQLKTVPHLPTPNKNKIKIKQHLSPANDPPLGHAQATKLQLYPSKMRTVVK